MKYIIRLTLISCYLTASIYFTAMELSAETNTVKNHTVKIAMAQIICIDGDLSGNLVRITNALDEATRQQADIIGLIRMHSGEQVRSREERARLSAI